MMESRKKFREHKIKNLINLNNGESLAISGFVTSKDGVSFRIDDGSGQATVFYEKDVNINDYVRAFGVVLDAKKLIMQADVVQNLNIINKKIHQKLIEVFDSNV